jgi:flagellar biosynthesis anti-sigma factor FlgM
VNISNASINRISGIGLPKVHPAGPAEEAGAPGADRVDVSRRASEVAAGVRAAKAAPEVREDRVAEAARKLREGSLERDAGRLADRLLSSLTGGE